MNANNNTGIQAEEEFEVETPDITAIPQGKRKPETYRRVNEDLTPYMAACLDELETQVCQPDHPVSLLIAQFHKSFKGQYEMYVKTKEGQKSHDLQL
jgi:hypothetical protein